MTNILLLSDFFFGEFSYMLHRQEEEGDGRALIMGLFESLTLVGQQGWEAHDCLLIGYVEGCHWFHRLN